MSKFLKFPLTRIILGLLLIVIVVAVVQLPFVFLQRVVLGAKSFFSLSQLPAVLAAAGAVAAYYFFVRWTERRPVSELSSARSLPEAARGVILGLALFGVTIL